MVSMTEPMRDFEEALARFNEAVTSSSDAMRRFADELHPEKLVLNIPLAVRQRAKELWDENPELGLLDVLAMAEREVGQ